ncbi:hypothetical protein [Chelativorans sp. YIM 93263]|uniref:hypothetical protein n=1 Tax=Chelativorans sp. YIM 93263 TaxID=2906648 RepID=UPI002379C114|nr:hypothetical protein [Chelativorans sp. YIM 93263]
MEANRKSLEALAKALLVSDTLEGDELDALIATIKPRLVLPDEEPAHEHFGQDNVFRN